MSIKKSFTIFITRLLLLTILLGMITFSIKYLFPDIDLPDQTITIFLFFLIITALIHYILMKANAKKAQTFMRIFFLSTFLKFFIYIIFIFGLILFNREEAKGIAVIFFFLYIAYTGFEIASMLGYIKAQKSS